MEIMRRKVRKPGSKAPTFYCVVQLPPQKLVLSKNGVVVPEAASSLPSGLQTSVCPGMLQQGFLGSGGCGSQYECSLQARSLYYRVFKRRTVKTCPTK